nr:hypothetical protein [Tanacetum cinerariifolium]
MGITIDCGPTKTRVKHLFGDVVRAMVSPGRSIVASLKNVNDFLAVNTPPYDLIRTDFEQEWIVPKLMLHIFEEFVLLLGRHPFNNKVLRMVVCKMGKPRDCGPTKTRVKHLFGDVVRAMVSPGRSIVASLKNVNDFLAVNTPPYDLIRTDFEQEWIVPKLMLHIFEEFVLLLGRHPFNNKVLRMVVCKMGKPREENPPELSRLGIFLSKEIFEGGVIRIHNAFVHDE